MFEKFKNSEISKEKSLKINGGARTQFDIMCDIIAVNLEASCEGTEEHVYWSARFDAECM